MEDRELVHIINNQRKLLELIEANVGLIAVIQQTGILDRRELDHLDAIPFEFTKTQVLLKILEGKTNGYGILLKAVTETKQSGAEVILRQLPQQNYSPQNVVTSSANIMTHSRYRLEFENELSMSQILQRLKYEVVRCLSNRNSNISVIMQLEALLLFDSESIEPITHGQYQTERERMTALFDVIKETGDRGILLCLEKLCDLKDLSCASQNIRDKIQTLYPGCVKLKT